MNRDLAAGTAGTLTHDMAHSRTGNLWWLLPPVAAFHRVSPAAANRLARAVTGLGAVLALTITIAQLSVHGVS